MEVAPGFRDVAVVMRQVAAGDEGVEDHVAV
jgi:hypothetical protein